MNPRRYAKPNPRPVHCNKCLTGMRRWRRVSGAFDNIALAIIGFSIPPPIRHALTPNHSAEATDLLVSFPISSSLLYTEKFETRSPTLDRAPALGRPACLGTGHQHGRESRTRVGGSAEGTLPAQREGAHSRHDRRTRGGEEH